MTANILRAPAKLTLSLRVTGRREDGYHLIDAVMVTLDLHDDLEISPTGASSSLTVDGPFAAGVPVDGSNLVLKALAFTGRSADVRVTKRIPNGGGLGGGSADAAAALRWAEWTDVVASSRLGADVPFCLSGSRRARVTGIGEIVEPIESEPGVVTLVVPPLHASTPEVYRAWDALGGPTSDGANDLEAAALEVVPELRRWRDRIAEAAGGRPTLAGSGATWFLEGDHSHISEALVDARVIVTGRG
jgi:4-diphosphocytidyl-2-C-methyl-D-erythritol kinase